MTLTDLSGLGLETTEDLATLREGWEASDTLTGRFIRDFDRQSAEVARLITALSEARAFIAHARETTAQIMASREATARKEERTRAATIARGNLIDGRYITWPCWNPDGNRSIEDDTADLANAIAAAIEDQS